MPHPTGGFVLAGVLALVLAGVRFQSCRVPPPLWFILYQGFCEGQPCLEHIHNSSIHIHMVLNKAQSPYIHPFTWFLIKAQSPYIHPFAWFLIKAQSPYFQGIRFEDTPYLFGKIVSGFNFRDSTTGTPITCMTLCWTVSGETARGVGPPVRSYLSIAPATYVSPRQSEH